MEPQDTEGWYGPETATFGDRVAAARDQSGMSQKQLSKRLGIKLKTLEEWEQDLSEPRANKLSMMAGLLNVSIMWLLNGQGDGVDAPIDDTQLSPDINELLTEIRDLKAQITGAADRLGRLEKQLRLKLKGD
ncbi:helix-turn-helix domain-containing protein [Thalassovita taeanensis]|uniref:Helix-turn-helix domain-containing protein n=1 Tax=Thalassovita taeanensis TaxID=657014 RepID=A0A1H9EJP5_9RHOB|nr:helix-turn-helix domain-containing protein [Thalassovita taeanensis]SEQ25822.1 Helix-turn-helix domain-containing protein [Thalassovita taeanensis]